MKMKAFSDGASPNLTKGSFILRHSHLRFLVTYGHYGLICFIFVAILWPGPVYLWLRSSIVWLRRFHALDRAQLRLPEDVLDGHARISH